MSDIKHVTFSRSCVANINNDKNQDECSTELNAFRNFVLINQIDVEQPYVCNREAIPFVTEKREVVSKVEENRYQGVNAGYGSGSVYSDDLEMVDHKTGDIFYIISTETCSGTPSLAYLEGLQKLTGGKK